MLTFRPRTEQRLVPAVAGRGVGDPVPGLRSGRWVRLGRTRPPAVLIVPAVAILGLLAIPLAYLIMRASEAGADTWDVVLRERTAQIFWNTAALAGAVAAATVVIAVPFAWLTSRTDLPGCRFWATAAIMPLIIPSYVGALTVVSALGPRGLVQQRLEPIGVERLPEIYGFWGAWLTLTLFTYPYVFLSVRAALRGLDPALEEATRCRAGSRRPGPGLASPPPGWSTRRRPARSRWPPPGTGRRTSGTGRR